MATETVTAEVNQELIDLKKEYDKLKEEKSRARGQDVAALQQQLDSIKSVVYSIRDTSQLAHQALLKGEVSEEEAQATLAKVQQIQTQQAAQDAISNMRRQVIDLVNEAGLDWHSDVFAGVRDRFDKDPVGARDTAIRTVMEQLKGTGTSSSTDIPKEVLDAAVEAELQRRENARQDVGETSVYSRGEFQEGDFLAAATNKRVPLADRMKELDSQLDKFFNT